VGLKYLEAYHTPMSRRTCLRTKCLRTTICQPRRRKRPTSTGILRLAQTPRTPTVSTCLASDPTTLWNHSGSQAVQLRGNGATDDCHHREGFTAVPCRVLQSPITRSSTRPILNCQRCQCQFTQLWPNYHDKCESERDSARPEVDPLRISHKTEYGASQFLIRLAVRAAPVAL